MSKCIEDCVSADEVLSTIDGIKPSRASSTAEDLRPVVPRARSNLLVGVQRHRPA